MLPTWRINFFIIQSASSREVSKLLLSQVTCGQVEHSQDIHASLSSLERELLDRFTRIEIRGKWNNNTVPVLFTQVLKAVVDKLIDKQLRQKAGIECVYTGSWNKVRLLTVIEKYFLKGRLLLNYKYTHVNPLHSTASAQPNFSYCGIHLNFTVCFCTKFETQKEMWPTHQQFVHCSSPSTLHLLRYLLSFYWSTDNCQQSIQGEILHWNTERNVHLSTVHLLVKLIYLYC